MPEAQEEFQKAVSDILEVIIFENWLRFYFIKEDSAESNEPETGTAQNRQAEETLRIEMPPETLKKISELYPGLYALASSMNGKPVDFECSRRAVLTHVLNNLDGPVLPKGMAQSVFNSSTFQLKLQLFYTWVQMHEEQLDKGFLEFGVWRKLFAQWLAGAGAKKLAEKLKANPDK